MRSCTVHTLVLLLAALPLFGQDSGQRHRDPRTNEKGLLAINTDYFDLAAGTGGDFYFWSPGEFSTANLEVAGRGEDVVLSYGATKKQPEAYEVPVESGARELGIFCGAQRKDLCVLIRPDGSAVRQGDEGVRYQSYRFMTIVFVPSPQPGIWKVELHGEGIHEVAARIDPGSDAPSVGDLDFVETRGRPGHEGWFEIERPLVPGETLDCQAEIDGPLDKVSFTFIDRVGTAIASPSLDRTDDGYLGRCTVPTVPFRVVVRGTDRSGMTFQRTSSHLVMPGQ